MSNELPIVPHNTTVLILLQHANKFTKLLIAKHHSHLCRHTEHCILGCQNFDQSQMIKIFRGIFGEGCYNESRLEIIFVKKLTDGRHSSIIGHFSYFIPFHPHNLNRFVIVNLTLSQTNPPSRKVRRYIF